MKLIFAIILWLINKITSILFLIAILTVLFSTRDTLESQALNLWNEVSGKNSQEIVNTLNKEIDNLKNGSSGFMGISTANTIWKPF
jgi:hypothetical protein